MSAYRRFVSHAVTLVAMVAMLACHAHSIRAADPALPPLLDPIPAPPEPAGMRRLFNGRSLCSATNNSGIQYRSEPIRKESRNAWVVAGYQHEVRNEVGLPNVAGFIYDEAGRAGLLRR